MNASRNIVLSTILSGFAILLLETGLGPLACAVPIKAECSEIQARIDYGNLTEDQLRFATGELEDCHGRQKVVLLPLLFVAACSRSDNAGDAGSVSAGETRALDNAAEMLQNQQLPVGAIPAQKTPVVKQVPTKAPPKPAG